MARYFNNKEVELLAPAGNFEIFKEVIQLGCDAVYFGGKHFNMRLHRKNYNFSDEELGEAIQIAHAHGKKAYITLNNMYNNEEVAQLTDFLLLLNRIKPDALIVQDFSVIQLIKELNIAIPIHSSVMMNVHNLPSILALKELGVTRVVLSRECTLQDSQNFASMSDMELEYFIHGDMCVTHGSQCIYSGILFGQSSNRGRCLKPCRWGYEVKQGESISTHHYPLAVKDMCMYEHIPELIHGGITSFKIEGRMRDLEYLKLIITSYGDSIDRYIANPLSYDRSQDTQLLYENRKRDTSTAYAFGNPGLSNINERYEGTGTLYSSGKVFSTATKEREITTDQLDKVSIELQKNVIPSVQKPTWSVKVNNMEQARICLAHQVDEIYLSGDVFLPDQGFTMADVHELASIKGNTKLYLGLPHMTFDKQFDQYDKWLRSNPPIDGLLVTNVGNLVSFPGYVKQGDYALNLLNQKSFKLYESLGLDRFTISPEGSLSEVISLLHSVGDKAQLIVHGSPTVMYMEHDLYANVDHNNHELLYVKDEAGYEHPIFKDIHNRNHMLLYKEICYLPILKELNKVGLSHFRLEIAHLDLTSFEEIISLYERALADLDQCRALYQQLEEKHANWSLGTFSLSGGIQ